MNKEPQERKRIKELEVMVADSIEEAHDTTTLIFFTGNDHLDYKPGHFLTIDPHQFDALGRFTAFLEDLKGRKEPPRAYSMSSSPHEKYLAITIKEERYTSGATKYPPLLSPLLVKRTFRGMRLTVTGFTGPYTLPDDIESQTDHLVHVCAGSGSVPNYSMLKFALANYPKLRHTFIYANKTWDDIIFRDALANLEKQNSGRLSVVHSLTRESETFQYTPSVRKGRITVELIRELIPDTSSAQVYVCGPAVSVHDRNAAKEKGVLPQPKFLESALASLKELGMSKEQITYESYG
ncbi:MAG: oxidoreductase [Bacteroidota bacterium]|nr:oxidoreductase [Bacteroidota bacterium]